MMFYECISNTKIFNRLFKKWRHILVVARNVEKETFVFSFISNKPQNSVFLEYFGGHNGGLGFPPPPERPHCS